MKDYQKAVDNWIEKMGNEAWYGVDLDGTLAVYDGWHGPLHIGEPVLAMLEIVKDLINKGKIVKIFTARCSEPDLDLRKAGIEAIQDWTEKHLGVRLEVTNIKDYAMISLYDDRAIQVVPNTGVLMQDLVTLYKPFFPL